MLRERVVWIEGYMAMCLGGHVHHPRGCRGLEKRQQLVGEEEGCQMVHSDGLLEPVHRVLFLATPDAGIVDEAVETVDLSNKPRGRRTDLVLHREVADEGVYILVTRRVDDLVPCRLRLLFVPCVDEDPRPGLRKALSGRQPDPGVGTCHEVGPAGLVGDVEARHISETWGSCIKVATGGEADGPPAQPHDIWPNLI